MPTNIAVTVHNGGTCTAAGFVTQFRTSLSSPTGPSESISTLNADESKTLNLPFVFTSSGNFEAIVEVDTGHSVPETNEANNLEILPITVLPPGINLVLDSFTVEPVAPDPTDSVVEGRPAVASITVTNTGNIPAGPFVVQWTPYAFGKPLTKTVSGLASGATTTVTMEYTFPFAATVTGTALVNSTGEVEETDTLDNSATLETVVQPPLPNLRVAPKGVHEVPAPAGGTSTLQVEIENDGNSPAGDFIVTWKPGPLIPAQSQQVDGLGVGAIKTISFSNVYKFAGTYQGTITVNSTHVINEVTTSDNTAPTTFPIPAATVDLTITGMSIHPEEEQGCRCNGDLVKPDYSAATLTQGEPNIVTVTVENLGNSPSPSFVTSWNPDTFGIIVPGNQTLTQETGPLGPDESRVLTFNFTYPKAGHFRTLADADAFNTVKETNEANNERILNVTVRPAPVELYFVTPIEFSPGQPIAGEPATASFTIANYGPIATEGFDVQFTSKAGGFPQTQFVSGLNVGEERTLTFPVTYTKAGSYAAKAVIDPTNKVVKTLSPDEELESVTVIPKSASLDVTLDHFNVFADPSGYQEWKMLMLVYQPGDACTFKLELEILGNSKTFEKTLKDVGCAETGETYEENYVNPGEELHAGLTLPVHLEENTPLIAAGFAVSLDKDIFGIITNVGFPGIAPLIMPRTEYLHASGLKKIEGTSCAEENKTVVNEGHCFDAYFGVSVLNEVGMDVKRAPSRAATSAASSTVAGALADLGGLGRTAARDARRAKRRGEHVSLRLSSRAG